MKQQQQKNEAAAGQTKKKKVTAAQLRVQKGESHPMSMTKIEQSTNKPTLQISQNSRCLAR